MLNERPRPPTIRVARATDAASVRAIYAPFVLETAISFEERAPTADEMRARIEDALVQHAWLVATEPPQGRDDDDGGVIGFAYATRHRARSAYRFAVETSVYTDVARARRGVGGALSRALLDVLRAQGFVTAYAGIALPNERSVALHERCGYARFATYDRVGFKLGRWHDVAWFARRLVDDDRPPSETRTIDELARDGTLDAILRAHGDAR